MNAEEFVARMVAERAARVPERFAKVIEAVARMAT